VTKQVDEEDYNDDTNTYEEVSDDVLDKEEVEVEDYKRKEGGPTPPKEKSTEDVDVKEDSEDSDSEE
jgi:heat shock protein beta